MLEKWKKNLKCENHCKSFNARKWQKKILKCENHYKGFQGYIEILTCRHVQAVNAKTQERTLQQKEE